MEVFYHGTYRLFDQFDIAHLGEGEGKSKFGQGIYITSSYATAALYAAKAGKANGVDTFYVYTLEVPDLTEDNHVFSCRPVNAAIVKRVEDALRTQIPAEVNEAGKLFRKYVGNLKAGKKGSVKQMMGKADTEAENAASALLRDLGVIYLAWPQAQTKPDGDTNRAVLDSTLIKIVKIDQVHVDAKNKLIAESITEVKR